MTNSLIKQCRVFVGVVRKQHDSISQFGSFSFTVRTMREKVGHDKCQVVVDLAARR